MNAPQKSDILKAASAKGKERAMDWLRSDAATVQAKALAEWKAVSYADAVIQYELEPHFLERLKEWEKGFDAAAAMYAAAQSSAFAAAVHADSEAPAASATTGEATQASSYLGAVGNPKFKNADRAAYELGHLLLELPGEFGFSYEADKPHMHAAAAAESHANNASHSILNGIEAIGKLMEVAGANGHTGLEPHAVLCLGDLLRHLAVEAQFMRDVSANLAYSIATHETGQVARQQGGRHAR